MPATRNLKSLYQQYQVEIANRVNPMSLEPVIGQRMDVNIEMLTFLPFIFRIFSKLQSFAHDLLFFELIIDPSSEIFINDFSYLIKKGVEGCQTIGTIMKNL